MSKKKPKAKPEPHPSEVVLALSEHERLQLGMANAEMRAAAAEHTLLLRDRAVLLAKIDPEGTLRRLTEQLAVKKSDLEAARQLHLGAVSAIEQRLGVKLDEYSYDDVTGTLHHLAAPPALTTDTGTKE